MSGAAVEGSLGFEHVKGHPQATVLKRIPVEASGKDQDGVQIHVLLHVLDGAAKELEIYKDDGSPILRMPNPREMQLLVLGESQ